MFLLWHSKLPIKQLLLLYNLFLHCAFSLLAMPEVEEDVHRPILCVCVCVRMHGCLCVCVWLCTRLLLQSKCFPSTKFDKLYLSSCIFNWLCFQWTLLRVSWFQKDLSLISLFMSTIHKPTLLTCWQQNWRNLLWVCSPKQPDCICN